MLAGLVNEMGVMFGVEAAISVEALEGMQMGEQIDFVLNKAREDELLPPEVGAEQLKRLWMVFRANHKANHRYYPDPYEGSLTLFRAKETLWYKNQDLTALWRSLAPSAYREEWTAGNHINMVKNPNAKDLAIHLAKYLEGDEKST